MEVHAPFWVFLLLPTLALFFASMSFGLWREYGKRLKKKDDEHSQALQRMQQDHDFDMCQLNERLSDMKMLMAEQKAADRKMMKTGYPRLSPDPYVIHEQP